MHLLINKKKNYYLEVFLMAFVIALSFLLPYMIIDKGPFLFFGDYCVQQVPFYSLVHDAIRSGNIFWNWNTDLGANFIGSYSFYNLGSPFFWLTLPLPNWLEPYTLGPLLALKIAVAAVTSYAFISRFTKKNEMAVLGALLYAFSSYSIYDIFFNHFHEPMAFFPLLLIGLEEYMVNNRKGLFAITVFISAFVNYFFFIGECFFLLIYFVIRLSSPEWKLTPSKFLILAFESLLGVGLSCILFFPSMLQVMGNPRTNQYLQGWDLLVYGWNQRLPDIIHSVFFPQDLPSRPNFFPDSGANWSSVAAWLPMFSMIGVISFMKAKSGHWLKRIIGVCFVIALIPGLNSLFVFFNSAYYGRWFYMAVLMMSLATVLALEDPEIDLSHGLRWTTFITLAIAIPIGIIPKNGNALNDAFNKLFKSTDIKKFGNNLTTALQQLGLESDAGRFWIYVGIVIIGLLATNIIYKKYKNDTIKLANTAVIALTVIICIYGNFFIATGKQFNYDVPWYEKVALNGADKITLPKTSFYRVDTLNGMDNLPMFWQMPTIQAFQSIVPTSIMKFYPAIGVPRDVGSRPDTSVPGIRPLLSVKYLFDCRDPSQRDNVNMPGWVADGEQLKMKVWKNNDFIPMGFTFDNYITQAQLNSSTQKDRVLLRGLVLSDDQIKTYSKYLDPIEYGLNDYMSDSDFNSYCEDRNKYTCSIFTTDNYGFSAKIKLDKTNLVFFSVPYDKGWTATVNGVPAKIEQVDVGFMAVLCSGNGDGVSNIRFNYMTPGLFTGIEITGVSILVLAGYLLLYRFVIEPKKRAAVLLKLADNNEDEEKDEEGNDEEEKDNIENNDENSEEYGNAENEIEPSDDDENQDEVEPSYITLETDVTVQKQELEKSLDDNSENKEV